MTTQNISNQNVNHLNKYPDYMELEDKYVRVNLDELDEFLESQCGEDYTPSHIDAVKSYLEYKKNT